MMRSKMHRARHPSSPSIPNLAPMVDVVMVILIFFMLGTSFALSEGVLPSQLPAQVGPGGAASVSIVPQVRIALVKREASDAVAFSSWARNCLKKVSRRFTCSCSKRSKPAPTPPVASSLPLILTFDTRMWSTPWTHAFAPACPTFSWSSAPAKSRRLASHEAPRISLSNVNQPSSAPLHISYCDHFGNVGIDPRAPWSAGGPRRSR